MCPFHDQAGGGSGGAGPVGCNCNLQQSYNTVPSGVIVESDAGGPIDLQRPPSSDIAQIWRAPAGGGETITTKWIAHNIIPEGGAPTEEFLITVQASDGTAYSAGSSLWLNGVEVAFFTEPATTPTDGDTCMWLLCRIGGVFTLKKVVRDPVTGVLSAP